MQFQQNPYFIMLVIVGAIGLINAFLAARHRNAEGALSLTGLMLALAGWAFAYSMELLSAGQQWQVFWAKLEYVGICAVPVFFFLFSLEYVQENKVLQRFNAVYLWVFPIIILALVWTNEFHHLIWTSISQTDHGSYKLLSLNHGIVFWVWTAYSYSLLLIGSGVLISKIIIGWREYRLQSMLILLGTMITWIGNIVYIFGLSPLPGIDLTPLSFIISGVFYTIGLFRFGIMDLIPIAGETVLESLDDVVLVLDNQNRVVYVNRAFEYFARADSDNFIGQPAADVLKIWPDLYRLVEREKTTRSELTLAYPDVSPSYFDARVSAVRGRRNEHLGRVFFLEENTERRRAEERLGGQERDFGAKGTSEIPLILVYRLADEKIIEVNRAFVLEFGYDRKDLLGRSLLQIGIWDAYQRGDFLREFNKDGSGKGYTLELLNHAGNRQKYQFTAQRISANKDAYVVFVGAPC